MQGDIDQGADMPDKDYNWYLKPEVEKYKGEYVIILNDDIVFHGRDLKKMVKEFRKKYPTEIPHIAKVPTDDILILRSSSW
jgi:hypoxanthine-guanine phosphoribosyltransferase